MCDVNASSRPRESTIATDKRQEADIDLIACHAHRSGFKSSAPKQTPQKYLSRGTQRVSLQTLQFVPTQQASRSNRAQYESKSRQAKPGRKATRVEPVRRHMMPVSSAMIISSPNKQLQGRFGLDGSRELIEPGMVFGCFSPKNYTFSLRPVFWGVPTPTRRPPGDRWRPSGPIPRAHQWQAPQKQDT